MKMEQPTLPERTHHRVCVNSGKPLPLSYLVFLICKVAGNGSYLQSYCEDEMNHFHAFPQRWEEQKNWWGP